MTATETASIYTLTSAEGSAELQRIAGYRRDNNWSDLAKHLTYQLQETIEQVVAFNHRDEEGFRDASADIRVLLDAQQASVTYDLVGDYKGVVDKLYTRFDKTEEDSELTQEKYRKLGVPTYIVYDAQTGMYVNRVAEACTGTDGENYPKDKWLKSHNVRLPEFDLIGLNNDTDKKIVVVENAGTLAVIGSREEIIKYAEELKAQMG